MNLLCPICSDMFVPSDDVNITPCGHMFHHMCLLQWLERSKSCPQCRNRCTEPRLVKVYFNVTTNLDASEDSATLLQKLDNQTLKIREQEKLLKDFEAKTTEHKGEQKKMRKTLLGLEEELRAKNTSIFAFKHEIDMLRGDRKTLLKVQEELECTKAKLQSYVLVKQALEATAQEVEQMLVSDMSRDSVIAMATALKRELQAQEIKRKEQSDRLKRLQNDLVEERRKRKTLEENLSTCDSEIYRLEQLCKQQQQKTVADTSTESCDDVHPVGEGDKTPNQEPNGRRKRPMQDLNKSTPMSEKVRKIVSSNSPYLRVKTSSIGLAPLMRGGLSANPTLTSTVQTNDKPKGSSTKYSIFSKSRISSSVSRYPPTSKIPRTVLDENDRVDHVIEENADVDVKNMTGSQFKLTSSTITARLKTGKLTRHPSTVSSHAAGEFPKVFDLEVGDLID
ncbi:E3 ubiquitin-protein ligase TRAIP [Anopheles nili]|uniref:E3 ubiquitin-protein ligase TRAIP n=1 Tax=Anopheles nili TaxID=185578 RepID=UPI00237A5474|nr:E3 ubiquitin-protein ligase TRAIP [Anopheles nili]